MPIGLCEPDEQVPPVVDEGDQTGRKPATGEIVRRESAPAPLILQFIVLTLPGILPPAAAGHALDGPFYVICHAQPEQIGQATCLALVHQRVRGKALVPTKLRWPTVPSYAIQKRPQSGNGVIRCMLVARHHLDVEDEPHIRQHVAVIDVAWAAGYLRIVAEFSSSWRPYSGLIVVLASSPQSSPSNGAVQ